MGTAYWGCPVSIRTDNSAELNPVSRPTGCVSVDIRGCTHVSTYSALLKNLLSKG